MPILPNLDPDKGEFYRLHFWKSREPGLPLYPFVTEETLRVAGPVDISNSHPYYLINFVTEGKIVHRHEKARKTLVPGRLLIVPPGLFSFHSDNGYHKYLIGLAGRAMERMFADFGLDKFLLIRCDIPEVLKIFLRLERNLGRKKGGNVPDMLGDCVRLLTRISLALRVKDSEREFSAVEAFRSKLEKECSDPHLLRDTARESGVSLSSLRRHFFKKYGISPKRFQFESRMRCALDLLEMTDKSMKEIADESGFQNQYYFSNAVKKQYDVSPRELRISLRQNRNDLILPSTRK